MVLYLILTPAKPNFIPKLKLISGWNSILTGATFFVIEVKLTEAFGFKYPPVYSFNFYLIFWNKTGLAINFCVL